MGFRVTWFRVQIVDIPVKLLGREHLVSSAKHRVLFEAAHLGFRV